MNASANPIHPKSPSLMLHVWIDFVCPYCLLGETVIQKATEGLDVEIEWMPFELRPSPTPTLRPEDDYLTLAWQRGVYPTAQRMGVPIQLPTVSPQPYTRNAFIGLQYAAQRGKATPYADAVLRAFFQQDLDIGQTDVLKRILASLGLDPEPLDDALASPEAHARHDAALRFAQSVPIRAVPSIAVEEILFPGMPDPETLRALILKKLEASKR